MDLLGYKDYFESHRDEIETFLTTITDAIHGAVSYIQNWTEKIKNIKTLPQLIIRVFSDNILIAAKCSSDSDDATWCLRLAFAMGVIQLKFIEKYGLFLRGALTKGMFYIDECFVFGEALIKVVELEKTACYPKILVDSIEAKKVEEFILEIEKHEKELGQELFASFSRILAFDGDGSFFVNYLGAYSWKGLENCLQFRNYFSLSPHDTPESIISKPFHKDYCKDTESIIQLMKHRETIIVKLKEYGNYNDKHLKNPCVQISLDKRWRIILKYLWSLDYHNKVCELSGFTEHAINTAIRIDTHTHQPIVEVLS